MTDKIQDGGPAFPLRLRDYFAAKLPISDELLDSALASGLMNGATPPNFRDGAIEWASWWAEAEARYRYLKADAMLKVRDGK